MITEWVSTRPDGSQVRSSNRYRFVSKDELEILSYRQVGNGTLEKIGFLRGKRMLNAEEAASTPDQPTANSPQPAPDTLVEAEVRAGMAERRKASLEGDTDKVESLMADEYLQTDVSGHLQNKSAWLTEYFKPLAALIKAGKFRWEVYEEKGVQIRVFGNAAVATGSLTLKPSGAIPVPGRGWVVSTQDVPTRTLRFTRVYIERNGKWLLAALHNAWLPEEGNK